MLYRRRRFPVLRGGGTKLLLKFENRKARIAELKFVETITVRQDKALMNEVKQHNNEEVCVWKLPRERMRTGLLTI